MKPLSVIKLIPRSHKAKNRIRENGDLWIVIRQGKKVGEVMEDMGADNDSFFIAPWKNRQNVRWIKKINDPDFNWQDVSDKFATGTAAGR